MAKIHQSFAQSSMSLVWQSNGPSMWALRVCKASTTVMQKASKKNTKDLRRSIHQFNSDATRVLDRGTWCDIHFGLCGISHLV